MKQQILLVLLGVTLVAGLCPHLAAMKEKENRQMPVDHTFIHPKPAPGYGEAVAAIDFDAVKQDLKALMLDSKDFWPADYGNYGPFFVRLAWHCSGSYRTSDGRGGCDGGRQRFDPERSWMDNTNLDKARDLLIPLKVKYGLGLSWGDLIVLAGTTAIESMGGPVLGFCGGRIDDPNGDWSAELGPTEIQEKYAPCPVNGECKPPLGSTTVGLIYLNPEGPMGKPDPVGSSADVRDAFGRMSMNDSETVALIGGGHAFGKVHGACPKGAGPSPKEDPWNPWPGECGTGKGVDAFTSGFEGPWTPTPTSWDNLYFQQLMKYSWHSHIGPGGHYQWATDGPSPQAPSADGKGLQNVSMLTSDISLLNDPTGEYQKYVKMFAEDIKAHEYAFSHAWYKLVSRDMGPVTRCVGNDVPPAQPFQNPLPDPPTNLPDFDKVKQEILKVMRTNNPSVLPADMYDGKPYYGALFVRLAFRCAGTFRVTDYLGGCNGARIRFSPGKNWPVNKALDKALMLLDGVRQDFENLSWADVIALAGTAAIEDAGGIELPFCGGRVDDTQGSAWDYVEPSIDGSFNESILDVREYFKIMGLSQREYVALIGGHSLGQMHTSRSGYRGSWTTDPTVLNNNYFITLFAEDWEPYTEPTTGKQFYKASGKDLFMLRTDLVFRYDAELAAIAQEYAGDNDVFLEEFGKAWTKLLNADRFDGPTGNVCDKTCLH